METICKLSRSLGKFRAIRTTEINDEGFCAEISYEVYDQYNNGRFAANFYTDGRMADIEINGWTFGYHIEGDYHLPGSYQDTNFIVEAIDPEGEEIKIYNTPFYLRFTAEDVLCLFLDLIHTYSNFKNGEIATKFYQLVRSVEGKGTSWRTYDEELFSPEVGLAQAKFFKEFYEKNINDCNDKFFMKKIKDAVNGAIDRFQDKAESYKII